MSIGLMMAVAARSLDPNNVYLLVNGVTYDVWESIRICRSLEAVSGSFEVTLTDRWAPDQAPLPIFDGDAVTVMMGDDVVITGWIDSVEISIDGNSHMLRIEGRDKTCDTVDCSALAKPGEWQNVKLEKVCSDLCAPYNIEVVCEVDTGSVIALFRTQPGETVFEAMERGAKGKGLFIAGTADGKVLITAISTDQLQFTLQEGVNILSATRRTCSQEQYSTYIVEAFRQDKKPKKASSADSESGMDLSR